MSFFKKTIDDVPIEGQTVLLRADYNVPLDGKGKIADDFRIRASLPTIGKLLEDNCKVVIIAHLGRPKGRDPKLSLEPIARQLATLLGQDVRFIDDIASDRVRMSIKRAPKKSVTVLENLRFYPGEEANDLDFARQLAKDTGARYFVQDGFGVVHRAHASTDAITEFLPSVAGLLLEREYTTLTTVMKSPEHPLVAVLGGAKVSDKISVIEAFVKVADHIVTGGMMANTFLKHDGMPIGASKYEEGQDEVIERIYKAARDKAGDKKLDDFIILPSDLAVAHDLDSDEPRRIVKTADIAADDIALDIGDASIERAVGLIEKAKTVVWSGTLGRAELSNYAHGSARIALALATHPNIESIVGGGDTVDFVLGWDSRHGESFRHVSTGGSASLELMAGKKLPGIESLLDA
jgi:phosphoglycerate kinase